MNGRLGITALLAVSAIVGTVGAWPDWNEPTRLTFLSVGQGDCAVFQTSGHTLLIDVGPKTPTSDAGKKIVLPDLRNMGIDSIDLILLSHPDVDHIGGLGALIHGMPVGRVAVSSQFEHFSPMIDRLREAGCPISQTIWLGADQRVRVGDFTVEVGCPPWHEPEPDNDGSEFVKIAGEGASAVFTGDASSLAEARMQPGHDWSAQILKLGHHGSHTASSEAFLESVHPHWAIISCGRGNPYGHPHKVVLDRVQRLGIRIARTDLEGDVTFELGPYGWTRTR